MKETMSKKMRCKKLVINPEVDKVKKNKSKRRKKLLIISDDDKEINKIKEMHEEINKKKKELEELTYRLKKRQAILDDNKNKKFITRLQRLPDIIISIIFRYAVSPHASKKEILDVYNQREKLRIQWEKWEQLPIPRQPFFNSFETDQEYINNNPHINLYELQERCSNRCDPCSMRYIPSEYVYNGNILMGRVKIGVYYTKDTRVEDVNTLRLTCSNRSGIVNCENIDIEKYYSKTSWRGNNETGTYKEQKKNKSKLWVYGWGPIRIDNIKTTNHGIISISFIDDLWYPSRRNIINELKYIHDYGVEFDKIQNMLVKNGFDISKLTSRSQSYYLLIKS